MHFMFHFIYSLWIFIKSVGLKWKSLNDLEREKYDELAREDKERYHRDCAKRDAEALAQQEERRRQNNITETDTRMRKHTLASTEATAIKESIPKKARIVSEEEQAVRAEKKAAKQKEENAIKNQQDSNKESRAQQAEARLKYLLGQSDIFSHFGAVKSGDDKSDKGLARNQSRSSNLDEDDGKRKKSSKRRGASAADEMDEDEKAIADELGYDDNDDGEAEKKSGFFLTRQPSVITGGAMRAYQLEGLNWMIRLTENGINGILADEMGLGKTLQSISVLGFFHEYKKCSGPHLVMVPKSTLSNWMNEFKRWCPVLRVVRFHGSKEEREEQIRDVVKPGRMHAERDWDVVVTTYEVLNLEKGALSKIAWKYLIIDEAHRLKNEASQFSQTVRALDTAHRLLLTGTPLQNNLHELWALLNFLLPDIFGSSEQFDDWFNLDVDDTEAKQRIIGQLHKILRPFMLRRLKADVEKSLPPKSETILFTGLSVVQKDLYKKILMRDIDTINGTQGSRTAILNIVMQLRKCCNHPYLFAGIEDRTQDPMGEHLYTSCGKMILLQKLLRKMFDRDHRVLIFSQMTRMLDILEDFLISEGFLYCRIDGNTTYEEREDRIADFNKEGSNKFIFLLSTRAGGLGINLQTADTVILYDSDWNPQADLQAQDRAHRIGQKKPVQVFRLVTDDTVEVKVVERAQQKLKLDAMVVQQGRLADKEKKLSKADLLESIRFGADKIFRSKDSTVTDADIDLILEEGRKRTEEMNEKMQVAEKGDMYDFRLDGGMSSQVFDGVDYSKAALREQAARDAEKAELAALAANFAFIDPGKRERKAVASYAEQIARVERAEADSKPKLPRHLRLPKMEDWQFYPRERLIEIHEIENKLFDDMLERGDAAPPGSITKWTILPQDLQDEKTRLLADAFGDWTRLNYTSFVKAACKYGRHDLDKIAKDIGKTTDEVRAYSDAFWGGTGEKQLSGNVNTLGTEFERHRKNVEKGEKRLEEINRLTTATASLIMQFEDPWEELTFRNVGTQGRIFNAVEDRFLLCLTHLHGYGNWDLVRSSIRRCERFRFDFYLQSCSAEALGKRCELLMRAAERELSEIERKKLAAEGMTSTKPRTLTLTGLNQERIAELTKAIMEEGKKLANTRASLQKLKGTSGKSGAVAAPRVRKEVAESPDGARDDKKSSAAAKPFPEGLEGVLAQLLLKNPSAGVKTIVSDFNEKNPHVSKRQVELKITTMAYKDKKDVDSKLQWYIKSEYLHLVGGSSSSAPSGESKKAPKAAAKKPKTDGETPAPKRTKKLEVAPSPVDDPASLDRKRKSDDAGEPKKWQSRFKWFVKAKRRAAVATLVEQGADEKDTEALKALLKKMFDEISDDEALEFEKQEKADRARYEREMEAWRVGAEFKKAKAE